MTKLKAFLTGVCAILVGAVTTPLMAGSGNIAGPYIAVQMSANGAVVNGTATNSNSEVTNGTLGKVYAGAGVQLGYAFPVSDTVLIGIDLTYNPASGMISLDSGAGDSGSDDITLDVGGVKTVSIMPMFSITDSSAVYIKAGLTHAALEWTGNVEDTSLNSSMRGEILAIGTRAVTDSGAFIQTEFGVNNFDSMNVDIKNSTGSATANPENVYGAVSLGFRF